MGSTTVGARSTALAGGAVVLLISLGWATLPLWRTVPPLLSVFNAALDSRVYAVSEVYTRLIQDPLHWAGHTLRVRGLVVGGRQRRDSLDGWVIVGQPHLVDPGGTSDLPLTWGARDPMLARLRGIPLLGRVLPAPQTMEWDRLATYRIELRKVPGRTCPDCYEAVLLDAT